jgi:UDP-glucuronate 4-epimerase
MTQTILVTGAAGFIGFHLSQHLCDQGMKVHGIDNLNDYYEPQLKIDRLSILEPFKNFTFQKLDLADRDGMQNMFKAVKPDIVINLAAQAGVRYSLENPYSYIDSNITGFLNILEGCRHNKVKHLLFASSSSVYGANTKVPFAEDDTVDHPVSLYAATKKSNEMMAHSYAHLYGIPCSGLRFFTVYGPWGRPDMAYFSFTKNTYDGDTIKVFNHGNMMRDFTYIDDVVQGITKLIDKTPVPDLKWSSDTPTPSSANAPYRLYNIGNNQPEKLMDFIHIIEEKTGIKAKMKMLPMQDGDVQSTFANTDKLNNATGFKPYTPLKAGISKFVDWYKDYYKV